MEKFWSCRVFASASVTSGKPQRLLARSWSASVTPMPRKVTLQGAAPRKQSPVWSEKGPSTTAKPTGLRSVMLLELQSGAAHVQSR